VLAAGNLLGGRYRLNRVLGEGGMGVVWAAVNESFGREVAIKVLLPEVAAGEPTALDRFFNEARICGSLRHPGIVDVLDVGRAEDGAPFLVMELLDGAPLDAILDRAGKLRPVDILPIIRDVARTLSLAHERGIVHRDLKPANLFLHQLATGQAVAKVLDFGISKVATPIGKLVKTRTGTVVGSPVYMSPEQAFANLELDGRSDVHSLGVILYQALSGRLPFDGESVNAIMIKIATQDPPPLASIAPGLPKPVLNLVQAAIVRDREARIPSAAALAERIEATLTAIGVAPSLPVPSPASLRELPEGARAPLDSVPLGVARTQDITQDRSKYRAPWLAVGAGALLIGALTAFLVWRATEPASVATAPERAANSAATAPELTVAPAPATAASAVTTVAPALTTAAPAVTTAEPAVTTTPPPAKTVAPATPRSSTSVPPLPAATPKKGDVRGFD
jgi:eukaryotic-like serine/threonine-protein kinase